MQVVNIGNVVIKINHRKFLDGIFQVCGVPEEKFCAVCSCIDALDKVGVNRLSTPDLNDKFSNDYFAEPVGGCPFKNHQ